MILLTVTISMLYVICLRILHYDLPESILYREVCYMYFLWRRYSSTVPQLYLSLYWYVCASYIVVCIDRFVYVLPSNWCLYFILGIFLYLFGEWVNIPLRHNYIYVCNSMCVNVIPIFYIIFWCTLYYLFLGCTPSWEEYHSHFL